MHMRLARLHVLASSEYAPVGHRRAAMFRRLQTRCGMQRMPHQNVTGNVTVCGMRPCGTQHAASSMRHAA